MSAQQRDGERYRAWIKVQEGRADRCVAPNAVRRLAAEYDTKRREYVFEFDPADPEADPETGIVERRTARRFKATPKVVGKKYQGVYGGPHGDCQRQGVHRHVPKGGRWA